MNRRPSTITIRSLWAFLGGVVLAAIFLGIFWAGIFYFRGPEQVSETTIPAITMVPAPSLTPVIQVPTLAITLTPTSPPLQLPTPNTSTGSIAIGVYVQISGTGGSGLRLRNAPGVNSPPLFLGMDAEAFQVQDGPKLQDGIVWWYLVAPYDKNRSGWAASNYLVLIQKP